MEASFSPPNLKRIGYPKNTIYMKFIDLFCGAGGFSLGFIKAGFKHLYGIDNWNIAYDCYKRNIGECKFIDIKSFKGKEGEADIVIGSPPCQTFSKANKNIRECDMTLTNEFLRIVNEIKPKIWIMENVPEIFNFLNVPYKYILDMSDFGLLQQRKRCFASNIPLEILPEHYKYLDDNQLFKLQKFREKAIHRLYQTIHGRFNSFDKTSPKIMDKEGVRLLSYEHALQIQTFPFYYQLPHTTQRNIEKLIGNAVPPLMAYKIAQYVKKS